MKEKRVVPKIYRFCAYLSVLDLGLLFCLANFSHLPSPHHELDAHFSFTELFRSELYPVRQRLLRGIPFNCINSALEVRKADSVTKPWLQERRHEKRGDLETTQRLAVKEGEQSQMLHDTPLTLCS